MTTQLRRYEIEPGRLDDMVAWFPKIVAVREQYGLSVEFACADHENNEFVWATSHPGDEAEFEAAVAVYNDSPERKAAFEGFASPVTKMHLAMVQKVG